MCFLQMMSENVSKSTKTYMHLNLVINLQSEIPLKQLMICIYLCSASTLRITIVVKYWGKNLSIERYFRRYQFRWLDNSTNKKRHCQCKVLIDFSKHAFAQ